MGLKRDTIVAKVAEVLYPGCGNAVDRNFIWSANPRHVSIGRPTQSITVLNEQISRQMPTVKCQEEEKPLLQPNLASIDTNLGVLTYPKPEKPTTLTAMETPHTSSQAHQASPFLPTSAPHSPSARLAVCNPDPWYAA
jgi:hypothetical protein